MFCTDLLLTFLIIRSVLWWEKRLFYDFRNNSFLVLALNCSTFRSFLWLIQKQEEFYWRPSVRAYPAVWPQDKCGAETPLTADRSVTWLKLLSRVEVWSLKSRSQEPLQSPRLNGTENTCLHLLNNTQTALRLYHQILSCSGRFKRLNAGLAFSSGLGLSTILNSAKPHQECVVQSN